jgi:hypothetical protein
MSMDVVPPSRAENSGISGSRSDLIFVLFFRSGAQSGQRYLAASILDYLPPGPLAAEAGSADRRRKAAADVVFLLDRELLGVQLGPPPVVAVELRAASRQEREVVQAIILRDKAQELLGELRPVAARDDPHLDYPQ